jgi:hypothetical protein
MDDHCESDDLMVNIWSRTGTAMVAQIFLAMVSASASIGNHSFKAGYFPDNVELRKSGCSAILFF